MAHKGHGKNESQKNKQNIEPYFSTNSFIGEYIAPWTKIPYICVGRILMSVEPRGVRAEVRVAGRREGGRAERNLVCRSCACLPRLSPAAAADTPRSDPPRLSWLLSATVLLATYFLVCKIGGHLLATTNPLSEDPFIGQFIKASRDGGVTQENRILLQYRECPPERCRLGVPRGAVQDSGRTSKETKVLACVSLPVTSYHHPSYRPQLTKRAHTTTSFVHGGAWRDPRATFQEVEPTIDALLDPLHPSSSFLGPHPSSRIAGFASLNYRLSAHPAFAQDLAHTPSWGLRTARHPDHLVDVLAGLRFLQRRFGFGGNYLFFGHSAGGFLNYQVLLGRTACLVGGGDDGEEANKDTFADVELPAAVVGFEGIYDLAGLNARVKGAYAGFMEAAFGPNEEKNKNHAALAAAAAAGGACTWDMASPATNKTGNFKRDWFDEGGKLAVLAQSPDDELVDMPECDVMAARLRADGIPEDRVLVFRDLAGGHFEVLRDGSFARVLKATLDKLAKL